MADNNNALIKVDKETRQKAKIQAAKKGTTIKQYIADLVEKDTKTKQQQPQQ